MKKQEILFVCNTVYQCFTAITLKFYEFKNENVDIIISDHMNNSYELYKNIKNTQLFNNTFYVKTYKYARHKPGDKKNYLSLFIREVFPKLHIKKYFSTPKVYDSIFVYNLDKFSQTLFSSLAIKNRNIKVFLYDEGLSTYTDIYKKQVYSVSNLNKVRKFLSLFSGRVFIHENINGLYLFDPYLICWNCPFPIHEIKKSISKDTEYINILNNAFGYKEFKDKYNKKLIFFEESFSAENIDVGDIELIEKIANQIGKDNIYVKIHPRNPINRFEVLGFETNKETGIPWEIIALNNDFSKQILLTISSSSVLSSRILFGHKTKTVLLYKCLKKKSPYLDESTQEYFEKFESLYGDNLYIIDSVEKIESLL